MVGSRNRLYTLAWLCALPVELAAAEAMLDETHPDLPSATTANTTYSLGKIAGHNIVVACLPSGVYGMTSATAVVSHLQAIFPNLRYGLMVGIGGGVPSAVADIRLGDIVVSRPTGSLGGVIQYDFGKAVGGGDLQPTGVLNQPPTILLTAVSQLEANGMRKKDFLMSAKITELLHKYPEMIPRFSRPLEEDSLIHSATERPIARPIRNSEEPIVHHGIIASGNRVIKDGLERDRIAQQFNALCFEMEAAGIMNHLPCLVIRGISDYCDSRKSKNWQGYAALVAAIYARNLLAVVPVNRPLKHALDRGCWMVPFDRNPRFVGRNNTVNQLSHQILSKDHARRAAISGLGGVGKTQIALELAYNIRNLDPARSIFWIPSTSVAAIEQAFMTISAQLGLNDITPANVKSELQMFLSSERAGSWLLIIDNADDQDMWIKPSASSPALKTFLPRINSHQGFILFTTRNQRLATQLAGPDVIKVSELDDEAAFDLLQGALVEKDLTKDQTSVTMLIHQLCGLPLALIQAASFINENAMSLEAYVSLLTQQENTELLSQDFDDDYRYPDIQNPITATWLMSFEQVQKSCALAAEYLSFIACIDARDIPLSLLPPASGLAQQKALGTLKAYSFVTAQTNNQFISTHRLVHLAIRNWLRKEHLLQKWTTKTAEHLNKVFPSDEHCNRTLWRQYLPHAQFLIESKEFQPMTDTREEFLKKVGECLHSDGRYKEAEMIFQELYEYQRHGADEEKTLMSMTLLALTFWSQGRWKESEEIDSKVLEARRALLGVEHPDTLISMRNLAGTYHSLGEWKKAEELNIEALEISKRVLGVEHPHTLISMGSLATTFWNMGRYSESEELEIEGLEILIRVRGLEHPETLLGMRNLASTFSEQGRYSEAEKLDLQVLEISRRVLGDEHPDTLASLHSLIVGYQNQGRWDEAEKLGDIQLVETSKKVLGADHPDTLSNMVSLATRFRNQERWKEVEGLERTVMETRKIALGIDHPDTLVCMGNLASTLWVLERRKEAEQLERTVVQTRERVLGVEHADTLDSMASLASRLWNMDRHQEAEELERKVMETRQQVLGDEHPDTLTSMANLAMTLTTLKHWNEAKEMQQMVLETRKRTLGAKHPDTLSSMVELAATLWNLKDWEEAHEFEIMILETRMEVLGDQHPDTWESMGTVALIRLGEGRWKEAEDLERKVLETRKKVLGADHPESVTNMLHFASTLALLKRWKEVAELESAVVEKRIQLLGEGHPQTLVSMSMLANTLNHLRRQNEAIAMIERCRQLEEKYLGADHPDTIGTVRLLEEWRASALSATGQGTASWNVPGWTQRHQNLLPSFHPILSLLKSSNSSFPDDDDID
ncbi:hypothetical protein ASPZODRAFT_119216 [Penicilliopsis zonata CBS 506.65]|uniref:Nucleoside phosphorylase domain-containing protein n=1 Tax=Penicilliopsis zonata CBS 506.65 TaxID=1073090 RepID=A0A1L9SFM9_9EURO|nr:hypothetical protein ASPZODRAFT_119216 [Penicilliopsis zonata CBS 506.65]OJJ45918.1 hypothetical protein ASPZODRAFT_119216 [Penicilliopsis zonata CBS 506.65]